MVYKRISQLLHKEDKAYPIHYLHILKVILTRIVLLKEQHLIYFNGSSSGIYLSSFEKPLFNINKYTLKIELELSNTSHDYSLLNI